MVAVPAVGDAAFAVWRSRAAGGATSVLFARSPNGMLWQEPATAARFPAGTSGCGDPPVAIAVDAANGAVHLAIVASTTSAGLIFLAESRDGGATFSAPARALVAERRGPVAIAALGDTLAVVYLEGARERPAVSLALSSHKGEIPAVVGAVSPEDNRPFAPAVALRDGRIAIAWNEPRGATRPASAVARVGRIVR
jgi:hypothetical protein